MPKLSIHFTAPPAPAPHTAIAGYASAKPMALGPSTLAKREPQWETPAAARAATRRLRCSRQGAMTRLWNSRPTATIATKPNSSGHRVSSVSSLRMSWTARNPISGRNSPNATRVQNPASLNARAMLLSADGGATELHLLHIRAAEQALGQEDQRDGEDREGGDVLVVDGKIGRPHGFDEADQEAADHGAGQRADAPQDRGREGFHARGKAVIEIHHAIIHEVHGAGDSRQRRTDHERDRDGSIDVDAEQRRHLLVLLAGALCPAEGGAAHQIPKHQEQ